MPHGVHPESQSLHRLGPRTKCESGRDDIAMFVNERLIYLQLQKTGCTHVAMLLDKLIGGEQVGKHNRLPARLESEGRLIVGSVRNPWDWYVSLWAYGCELRGGLADRLTSGFTIRGHGDFHDIPHLARGLAYELRRPRSEWSRVYSNVEDPRLFRGWLAMIHDPRHRHALGKQYSRSSMSFFGGFFTYRYAYLYSRNAAGLESDATDSPEKLGAWLERDSVLDRTIRMEHLEADLLGILRECGFEIGEEQAGLLRTTGKTNYSRRRVELAYYYDAPSIELVGTRDAYLVRKYGYSAPDCSQLGVRALD